MQTRLNLLGALYHKTAYISHELAGDCACQIKKTSNLILSWGKTHGVVVGDSFIVFVDPVAMQVFIVGVIYQYFLLPSCKRPLIVLNLLRMHDLCTYMVMVPSPLTPTAATKKKRIKFPQIE